MPTIKRKGISQPKVENHWKSDGGASYYQSPSWQRLRLSYIMRHPLCECCLQHCRVEPAVHVHHRVSFMSGKTEQERLQLLLSESNLMSVCQACHSALHRRGRMTHERRLDELNDVEYEKAHETYDDD